MEASRVDKLGSAGWGQPLSPQVIIDARAGELTHVVLRFSRGLEVPLAGEFKMLSVSELDVTLPCPRVGVTVFAEYTDEGLAAVRIGNFVPGSFLIIIILAHTGQSSARRVL